MKNMPYNQQQEDERKSRRESAGLLFLFALSLIFIIVAAKFSTI